jgi:hypothetical protein
MPSAKSFIFHLKSPKRVILDQYLSTRNMMIFSCTKKVLDKIKKYKPVEKVKEAPGQFNWYVDLINLNRKNCFLFTHSETLFSFFIYMGTKKEINNMESLFEEELRKMLIKEISNEEKLANLLLPAPLSFRFLPTNSRKVLGSMNDFKNQIKAHVWKDGGLSSSPELIKHWINEVPMGANKYKSGRAMMKAFLIENGD